MAPAGNNKDSQAAMDATFLLESNIVPQVCSTCIHSLLLFGPGSIVNMGKMLSKKIIEG
jgi:hypothetical protein